MNRVTYRPLMASMVMLVLVLTSPLALAREAGRLLFVQGDVRIVNAADQARTASRGDVLDEGERVVTGRSSVAQIRLNDGGLIALRSNSDYLFEQQRYDEEDSSLSAQAGRLFRGFMRSVTGAVGNQQASNVSHSTPVATIGIRGTVFQVIHIPEEGLEDFPDTPAGTYLLVEEGGVEMFNEGGRSFAGPGDVVYVADINSPPVPAPGRRVLFRIVASDSDALDETDEDEIVGPDDGDERDDGRVTRDGDADTDEIDTRLNETLGQELEDDAGRDSIAVTPPASYEQVTALTVFPQVESAELDQVSDGGGMGFDSVSTSGTGAGRTLAGWNIEGSGSIALMVEEGASAFNTGYHVVTNAFGQGVAEINWGRFAASDVFIDFDGFISEPQNDVHWMLGSFSLVDGFNFFETSTLTGRFTYNYVGGTGLAGLFGDSLTIGSGSNVVIDFGMNQSEVFLALSNGVDLAGGGAIGDLYGSGWFLMNDVETWGGSMTGAFLGSEMAGGAGLEGLIAMLELFGPEDTYYGNAAFQNSFVAPFDRLGGVGATVYCNDYCDGDGPTSYGSIAGVSYEDFESLSVELINGEPAVVWQDIMEGEIFNYTMTVAENQVPRDTGSAQVTNEAGAVVSEVYWGIWDAEQYQLDGVNGGTGGPEFSSWDYMLASQSLTLNDLTNLGVTGGFEYSYVGGTGLTHQDGVQMIQLADSSSIAVNFDASFMEVNLALQRNGENYDTLSGLDSLTSFYEGGVVLGGDFSSGNISGAFVGAGAEGIISHIQMGNDDGLWAGSAAFADRVEADVAVP